MSRRPTLRAVLGAAAISFAAGCATQPTFEARALAPGELAAVREEVRGFAKTHCGSCHQSTLPTANAGALRIYDLDARDWSRTLTADQLKGGFPRRLNGRLDEAGQQRLRTFIEGELVLRGG